MTTFPGWTFSDVAAITLPQLLRLTAEMAHMAEERRNALGLPPGGMRQGRQPAATAGDRMRETVYRPRTAQEAATVLAGLMSGMAPK